MRPLPPKTHGIIHTVKVKKEDIEPLAKQLKIPDKDKNRMREGDEIHIIREAEEHEINRNRK